MPFKFFNCNLKGRDFVVGDIHGQFSALEMLLLKINFDMKHDRVFSVGDLIDRGPESWRVIEFLNYPWFHAIRGNHEQMLLDSAEDSVVYRNWIERNGGKWWASIPPHLHSRIRDIIVQLPLVMEINSSLGRMGIVHADIPSGISWAQFVSKLEHDNQLRDQALWARNRFRQLQLTGHTPPVSGIDLVIMGHTPVSRPLLNSNLCYIDTGATYTEEKTLGQLTLLEIQPEFRFHRLSVRTGEIISDSSNSITTKQVNTERACA
ncbi:MAG: phosphoprotein phosphatase [Proteobacteria bacterium]|nr:MAG: phosphoprotein phosphatase [Pseudomonadota bacterium]